LQKISFQENSATCNKLESARLWVDEPPPERNLDPGIGKHIAQQTTIHREAVKKALEKAK
jgi:hypothetical protein